MELDQLNPNQVAHRADQVRKHLLPLDGDSIRAVLEACGVLERLEMPDEDTPDFSKMTPDEQRTAGMSALFRQVMRGNANAARVWKEMVGEAKGEDQATNILFDFVPYDVPDLVKVPREDDDTRGDDSDDEEGDSEESQDWEQESRSGEASESDGPA